jgi:hypothetical protein
MSDDFVNQLTLNCLISKKQLQKLNRHLKDNTDNIKKTNKEIYGDRVKQLFNDLLVDKPMDNVLQEVNIGFDYFFDKCVYYFKAIDNNESLEKDRFDTNNTDIIGVWFDWNRNGVFDATEWTLVNGFSSAGFPSQVNVSVPFNAVIGTTLMRVRTRVNGAQNGSGDACSQFGSGNSIDVPITILSPCVQPPPPTIVANGPTTFCAGGSVGITAPTGTGYSYIWSNVRNFIIV